jgi:hypothetical protein
MLRTVAPAEGPRPSGRLAIVINANAYGGLRRTYSDRKTRRLEDRLPDVLGGFAEHAALIRERHVANEDQERRRQKAEARYKRETAFEAREKRRMDFTDAIHDQLAQRAKLAAVLSHLERVVGEEAGRVEPMRRWLRRRIDQIDALTGHVFLDISASFAEIDFAEPVGDVTPESSNIHGYDSKPAKLRFWVIDEARAIATLRTPLQWAIEAGFAGGLDDEDLK